MAPNPPHKAVPLTDPNHVRETFAHELTGDGPGLSREKGDSSFAMTVTARCGWTSPLRRAGRSGDCASPVKCDTVAPHTNVIVHRQEHREQLTVLLGGVEQERVHASSTSIQGFSAPVGLIARRDAWRARVLSRSRHVHVDWLATVAHRRTRWLTRPARPFQKPRSWTRKRQPSHLAPTPARMYQRGPLAPASAAARASA